MRITCEIIKDLLPLYHDNVCSKDSCKLVEEHLLTCEKCRNELKQINIEIKMVDNTEDVKVMNTIAKKWKQDRFSSFFAGIFLFSTIASVGCVVAYNLIGSYVTAEGFLVEPFALIPLSYLFGLSALLSGVILGIMAIKRRMVNTK
ncbi:DUF3955 domain-containing protein [Lacrimispora sp.]|uniref:DUF3955 domain-containing protein n=1 Tax=Lacrimispora sp. TaxID=2719234 RepID=UPI002897BC89|nr:DUF3955 domain-containing protein [Lacrimispora sp.]